MGLTSSLTIYKYTTPIVTLKQGNGRIINGNFKLIHVINLTDYEEIINRIRTSLDNINPESSIRIQLIHQMNQTRQLISELKGQKSRSRRSINWIGSAWKWIAGSPDATDWDQIIKSQNHIIDNNNQQYKINNALMTTARQILNEYNKIVDHLHEDSDEKIQQILFNRLTIIKEEIKEIIRAAQLAKGKIINTNLLDKEEVSRLVAEIETLPYSNDIEAIEYAEPMMLAKESTILYVISIPKTSKQEYNHVVVRSTVESNKQIYLEYNELLVNQDEIFGIIRQCKLFRENILCEINSLEELKPDHCINQLIRGLDAQCNYQFNKNQIIDTLNDNTIFLSNFKGDIFYNNTDKHLEGSFLIQYDNETIKINNTTFTSRDIRKSQVLPTVLQPNITDRGVKIDPGYLHNLHLNNVDQLQKLFTKHKEAAFIDFGIISIIFIVILILLLRTKRKKWSIPKPCQEEVIISQSGVQPISLNF